MRKLKKYKKNLQIIDSNVYSYATLVAIIEGSTLKVMNYSPQSVTTSKHINYVASELCLTKIYMAHYLCIEHGEEFLLQAVSLEEAREEASMWGGEAICKVRVVSQKGNEIEFIKTF